MKNYLLLAASMCLMVSCGSGQKVSQPEKYSQRMVESHGLVDFYCNRHHQTELDSASWDYVSGLVANAVLKAWTLYPEKTEYYDAVKAFADNSTTPDGSVILNAKGESALRPSNIDDLPAGNVFFTLYKEELKKGNTKDANRYKNAASLIRNKLKYDHSRIPEGLPGAGGFFHKAVYPNQMWLDGLYMGSTIYAQWQHVFGQDDAEDNAQSWADIALQFKTINKYTYDEGKQLNYHAWSATPEDENSFWANQEEPFKGCSKEFWARGMGWYFAALADVLEYMPKDHADYPDVLAIFNQVAAGLKPVAEKAYQGLLKTFIREREDGKLDVVQTCASAGLGPAKDPSRTGTVNYYLAGKDVTVVENEGKAVGTFILASVEYEQLVK